MTSLGFITLSLQQEKDYAYKLAKRAHLHNITFYRFTPDSYSIEDKNVHGLRYDHLEQDFVEDVFPIPSYLYDRCFYKNDRSSMRAKRNMRVLKNQHDILFLGYGLPNKKEVFSALQQHQSLSCYIPYTTFPNTPADVYERLKTDREIVLKPLCGSGGRGILFITLQEKIHVYTQDSGKVNVNSFSAHDEFISWLYGKLLTDSYLIQPYLNMQWSGSPSDIRLLVQKKNETWIESVRAIRKGKKGTLLTNLSQGGEISSFIDSLYLYDHKTRLSVQKALEDIVETLPKTLDYAFGPLFELGIDIAFTKDGRLFVIDINSKPGRKISSILQEKELEQVYNRPFAYICFLEQRKGVEQRA
ncbi:hypothetical protein ABD68_18525 [Bacillus endophyticus]|uniref:YheC/YheD family endospore coat-associated protein n=1 Tax=Priestia endophytica TaxID=135735 RepID=UPI0018CE0474|nr:YheC/YheD family protein [Priestia endophytica]MBG9810993.1 hypothetical protein [Priestia endophytica]MBG9813509.1 hypothetical protein [Priestia endophytica]